MKKVNVYKWLSSNSVMEMIKWLSNESEEERCFKIGMAAILAAILKKYVLAYDYQKDRQNALIIGRALVKNALEHRNNADWNGIEENY